MEQKTQKQEKRRFVLVFLIVGLVLANVVLIYLILSNKNAEIANQKELLQQQKEDYEKDLETLQDRLEKQISETKRIEGKNQKFIDSLQQTLEKVIEDRDQLKNSSTFNQAQLREYRQKIDAYEILLRKKDDMITKLRKDADALYGANQELKEEKMKLTGQVADVEQEVSKLEGKLDEAAVLRAENVNINALDDRGKVRSGGQYRANRIDQLSISFNLADNKFAEIGGRDIYMRVLEPAGTVLINPGSSGTFDLEGRQAQYSARQNIIFDNSRQTVRFQFNRSGQYEPGRHTVELYADGVRIGYGTFDVR